MAKSCNFGTSGNLLQTKTNDGPRCGVRMGIFEFLKSRLEMLVMELTSVSYDWTPSRMLSNLSLKLVAFWFFRLRPISRIWHRLPNEAGAPAIEKKSLPRQPPIPASFTPQFLFSRSRTTIQTVRATVEIA